MDRTSELFVLMAKILTEIERAWVNDTPVEFTHADAISQLSLGPDTDITHHQTYKSKYLNALREADEGGELSIKLPENCIRPVGQLDGQKIKFVDVKSRKTSQIQPNSQAAAAAAQSLATSSDAALSMNVYELETEQKCASC